MPWLPMPMCSPRGGRVHRDELTKPSSQRCGRNGPDSRPSWHSWTRLGPIPATKSSISKIVIPKMLHRAESALAAQDTRADSVVFRFGAHSAKVASGSCFAHGTRPSKRNVALKVPQPESVLTAEAHRRFLQEARAAAGLDHPNIVPVYETGCVGSVSYIATAFCPGPTLAGWLERQTGFVPERDAASLVATLALAVQHAHERGVLHRDLKPGNILLRCARDDGLAGVDHLLLGDFQPRITDFSLANVAGTSIIDSRTGSLFGSPPYMAPEQAQGQLTAIGPATDVYALGCILYELLTGKPPFRGKGELDTFRQVITDQPIPPRWRRKLSAPLQAIVMKCLEKIPDDRYITARDLAADLHRFLGSEPIQGCRRNHGSLSGGSPDANWAALVFFLRLPLGCGIIGPVTLVRGPARTA